MSCTREHRDEGLAAAKLIFDRDEIGELSQFLCAVISHLHNLIVTGRAGKAIPPTPSFPPEPKPTKRKKASVLKIVKKAGGAAGTVTPEQARALLEEHGCEGALKEFGFKGEVGHEGDAQSPEPE